MSPRIAYIQSASRRRSARLAIGALLAVSALGGCSWTEEEWRALGNRALCGVAFDCGNGNSNMGNVAQSDSDSSSGSSSTSTGSEGTTAGE